MKSLTINANRATTLVLLEHIAESIMATGADDYGLLPVHLVELSIELREHAHALVQYVEDEVLERSSYPFFDDYDDYIIDDSDSVSFTDVDDDSLF